MSLYGSLKPYFSAARIAKRIEAAPPIVTTVADYYFPKAERQQFESPVIPVAEIQAIAGCVPVVRRGAASIPMSGDSNVNTYIEPLPVRLHASVSAVELNNLKIMTEETREGWAARKTLRMRAAVNAVMEVLCAQAIFSGKISYPLLQPNGQFATYEVTYNGDIATQDVAAADKWDAETAGLDKVFKLLEAMATAQDKAGFGGHKDVWVGATAYTALLALIEAKDKTKVPVVINADGTINIGRHKLRSMSESWTNPNGGASVPKVEDKEIRMVSKGYTGFFYGPVDDLDANLVPMPMFIKPVQIDDPSELRLIGESKPLPAVAPKATRKAVVVS